MNTEAHTQTIPNKTWLLTLVTALLLSATVLGACENTYRGAGHDMDEMSDEMKDGWD